MSVLIPQKLVQEVENYGDIIKALEEWIALQRKEKAKGGEKELEYLPGFEPFECQSDKNGK